MIGTFLEIEGALNNIPHEVVYREAARRGVPAKLVEWIQGMLGWRVLASRETIEIMDEWVEVPAKRNAFSAPMLSSSQ